MKRITKIILISAIVPCFILIGLAGMGLYLYYHPERLKPMIERSLSAATGASCTMERISFSLRPMVLEARGIFLKTRTPEQAASITVPFIRTDITMEGPWGHRALILKNMRITGLFMDGPLPAVLPVKKESSFPARMVQGIVSLFFFRDIRFQSGEILDGRISTSWGDQTIQIHRLHAEAGGDKPLSASFAMEVENASRKMHVTAPNVTLAGNNVFDMNDFKFDGTLKADEITFQDAEFGIQRMDAQSHFTYRHAHGMLNAENVEVRIHGLSLNPASMGKTDRPMPPMEVHLQAERISSRYPAIEITNAAIQIPQAKVRTESRDISIGDIRLTVPDGRIDTETKTIAFPKIRCDALGLQNILLAIDIKSDLKGGGINLTLQGEKTALFQAAAAYHLLPRDLDLSAGDSIRIELAGPLGGPWQVNADLSLADLAFKNKDESVMGEKISLTTKVRGAVNRERSGMTFTVDAEANAGEVLYDRYYLNLAENPIVSSCNGGYRFQKKILQISMLRFNLTDILPLEIQGTLTPGASIHKLGRDADFKATLPRTPVKPIFHHLLQEPYKTEKNFLAALETGGTVSAECAIKKSGNIWEVTGQFGWREGNFTIKDGGISLTGIHLDLPVWYKTGLPEAPAGNRKGRLEVKSLKVPLLPEQPLRIVLDAGPNRLSVDSPTMIQVPGGELRLGPVQVKNLFSRNISVHTRLAFDGIDMQSLLSGLGAFPPDVKLEGNLTGTLDSVRYEKHTVTSQGEISAMIFGGKITASDLGASGIFTPASVFTCNARWDDLRLSQMTTDDAFGKIEGVLQGHVNDLEIAHGQPQRFDLVLETVKRKGIAQAISIKAVDNIARIGGGQSPFMGLAGAFASVFEKFTYEKIGIRARLENDMFMINGAIREGGTEYIVKRHGFSGVNIINQNPDNRIRFKDMVKRIRRIAHKGGAATN